MKRRMAAGVVPRRFESWYMMIRWETIAVEFFALVVVEVTSEVADTVVEAGAAALAQWQCCINGSGGDVEGAAAKLLKEQWRWC